MSEEEENIMIDATTAPGDQTITLPVAMLRDARLSPDARAVLALALTFRPDELPSTFMVYLREQGVGDRPAARAIAELEAHGYLRRQRVPVHGKAPTTRAYRYDFCATPAAREAGVVHR